MIKQLIVAAVVVLAGCARDETDQKRELTQREKDSVLAHSQIPGAKAVNKAFNTADSARARQARIDSAQQVP